MKYFLRKTKFNKEGSLIDEIEINKNDTAKQIKDNKFDKTEIHICNHEEGLPCELIDV